MTIKADRWIRRMVQDHSMIEPFVEGQVRDGVISYGLSSYGYDMRVADEFKVFTNVFNTLVDPKHFDQRSFVDIKADYCDIPPNSFALARSVEFFRIPRNVLAICLGKSTYARCFRGDTRVALADGSAPTLEALARRAEQGEQLWGYSVGPGGRVIVARLESPRYIGRDMLVELRLDTGQPVYCTPDHQFLRRDGRMAAAGDLRPGDSLMPLYRRRARGGELVYQPASGRWGPARRSGMGRSPQLPGGVRPPAAPAQRPLLNHKVASVRAIPGDHDVYCLTVPEAGNFALEAGVFVHNCGIILNTTPFEPGWRGYVTLEISNTTPLPARIYANEGIGQVLFFESDEDCEVSYDDKHGKYLDQVGVVLPRL